MRCLVLLVGLLVLVGLEGRAQSPITDSLRHQLAIARTDTDRVLILKDLAYYAVTTDPPLALQYARQGRDLAHRIGYRLGEIRCLNNLGLIADTQEDYLTAARYYQQAVRLCEREPRSRRFYLLALLGLGNAANGQKNYPEASGYLRQALAAMQAHPRYMEPTDWLLVESFLATLYDQWGEEGPKPVPDSIRRQHEYFARRALATAQRLHLPYEAAICQDVLGMAFDRYKNHADSAGYHFRHSLRTIVKTNDKRGEAIISLHLGEWLAAKKRWAEAMPLLRTAIRLGQELGMPQQQAYAYRHLANALAAQNQGQAAFKSLLQMVEITDTLQSAERREAIARLQVSFDTERKEGRIKALTQQQLLQQAEARRQRQQLWALAAVLAAVGLGLGGATWLALRLRRSRAQLAAQNEELAQARATQDRLYSVIAHDLRSPLVAFTGLADMVRTYREQGELAALDELTGEVGQTAERLTGLLDNLLHWAASQTGELAYRPETLDATALLHDTAALYAPAARARQVTLSVEAAPELPDLWADYNMTLTQLRNLTGNALKVAPKGSTLVLAAQPGPADGVELLVRDAGPGLTAEQLAALNTKGMPALPGGRRQRGTGLGLPLVKQLAARQQGVFRLESVPGQGTTARLLLPAATAVVAVAQ